MTDASFLRLPFFEKAHADLVQRLDAWATVHLPGLIDHHDIDGSCCAMVAALGRDGWLDLAVPPDGRFDVRSLCLVRETLGRHSGLADFAFAMQGLGTGAITLFGTPAQKEAFLPAIRAGRSLAAFALSEADAGSDVAAMVCAATPVPGGYRLNGAKTWISNGGIAGQYVVFARTGSGTKGISAFVVPSDAEGFSVVERIDTIAPHPLATLRFTDCFVPDSARLGQDGEGFKIAMATLDVFRPSVGAAALGFARRALEEAGHHAMGRRLFGATLADQQLTQAHLAEMTLDIEAGALLVYRAAWVKDRPDLSGCDRITKEAALAKWQATEGAQRVIDKAVQMFGGMGVKSGMKVEELYREIRALRIYEGATEVQKLIVARQVLAEMRKEG